MDMDASEARVEFGCRMFEAQKLTFHAAMKVAMLDRLNLEAALKARGIAVYRPTADDLRREVDALKRAGV